MRRILLFVAIGIIAFTGESFSQAITSPAAITKYGVLTNSSGPCVRLYTGSASVDIQIDGTKFSEYILAALMVYPVELLQLEVWTNGTDTKYRFLVNEIAFKWNASEVEIRSVSHHVPKNLGAIGFCKYADGSLEFELFLGTGSSYGSWTRRPLTLGAGATYKEKVQFDFLVSSIINYYDTGPTYGSGGGGYIKVNSLSPPDIEFHRANP